MIAAALLLAQAAPAGTPAPAAGAGIEAAVLTCEAWLARPATRTGPLDGFPARAGLAGRIVARPSVPDAALPPPNWRVASHHWYAAMGAAGGAFITVSDQLPVCNVVGGGGDDLQPAVEQVLASPAFAARWRQVADRGEGEMRATRYANQAVPTLGLLVTRAARPGERRDRPQLVITALQEGGK